MAVPVPLMRANTLGPLDPLYLTANGQLLKIQGNSATAVSTVSPYESAIAVTDTIRTVSWSNLSCCDAGAQYTTSLVSTGVSYSNPVGNQLIDGTSDGTYNYAVLWYEYSDTATNVDKVYRFNADWTNPVALFTVPAADTIGISYDGANNSLWVQSRTDQTVSDYTLGGTLLSTFSTVEEDIGLAYDPGDGTLWTSDWASGYLHQYSTSGTELGTKAYAALSSNRANGLDFAETASAPSTPEPGTIFMVSVGVALLALGRERFGRK
jgi:hypothetical protein